MYLTQLASRRLVPEHNSATSRLSLSNCPAHHSDNCQCKEQSVSSVHCRVTFHYYEVKFIQNLTNRTEYGIQEQITDHRLPHWCLRYYLFCWTAIHRRHPPSYLASQICILCQPMCLMKLCLVFLLRNMKNCHTLELTPGYTSDRWQHIYVFWSMPFSSKILHHKIQNWQ